MSEGTVDRANGSVGVLICDDAEPMRRLLGVVVTLRAGLHVVGEAADGVQAISEARRLQPNVILLDLSMPVRTGLDALPEIKRVAPGAKVIVFSGFATSTVAADVLAQGADRYLEKGMHPDALAAMIEEVAAVFSTAPASVNALPPGSTNGSGPHDRDPIAHAGTDADVSGARTRDVSAS